ncbi:PHP domain-containing protein [Paenibacillus nanensis]|uniref:PHP domain-containing protein n=1 Tax=Paenibacillus nanensis TaxID=393251 RepID=A0A3A1UR93_9BACL|nr:PHP domain-containing protein [Paenibacillus nanensis]RIX49941.1 PHP domain-containing protein [Paenibacillus nanensis]
MVITTGRVDLHTHSTASDGLHAPAEVVQKAKQAGLAAVALTDHDTVSGVAEAMDEGDRIGIIVVPGVELSTVADGIDIHVLAYYTDNQDELWLERLAGIAGARERRNELILDKLQRLGIGISMEDVRSAAAGKGKGGSIGRPHFAEALIRKGVVSSMNEAFERFLGAGAAAYVRVPRVHPLEAIEWIREAGGVSVIAHPGLYGRDELVEELVRGGATGIETIHSDHGEDEERRYGLLAQRFGLIETGGSDFHGERGGETFHGAVGSKYADLSVVDQLRQAARGR